MIKKLKTTIMDWKSFVLLLLCFNLKNVFLDTLVAIEIFGISG